MSIACHNFELKVESKVVEVVADVQQSLFSSCVVDVAHSLTPYTLPTIAAAAHKHPPPGPARLASSPMLPRNPHQPRFLHHSISFIASAALAATDCAPSYTGVAGSLCIQWPLVELAHNRQPLQQAPVLQRKHLKCVDCVLPSVHHPTAAHTAGRDKCQGADAEKRVATHVTRGAVEAPTALCEEQDFTWPSTARAPSQCCST